MFGGVGGSIFAGSTPTGCLSTHGADDAFKQSPGLKPKIDDTDNLFGQSKKTLTVNNDESDEDTLNGSDVVAGNTYNVAGFNAGGFILKQKPEDDRPTE